MLVTLGTAHFARACSGVGVDSDGLPRVIQFIITGIGFIGAGSIPKLSGERDIEGLTTAAGVWTAAAVGVAVGPGSPGGAILSTVFTLITLPFGTRIERRAGAGRAAGVEGKNN